jgi:uncharacterized protein YkwD
MRQKTFQCLAIVCAILSSGFFSIQVLAQAAASIRFSNELNGQRIIRYIEEIRKPVFSFSENQIITFEREVFQLINKKRVEMNLPELEWSEETAKVARFHAENMAKFGFFSHVGLDGKMVDERADYFGVKKWRAIGENIAYIRGYEKPTEVAVEKWLLSASHRENLLSSRWKETGIGIAVTDNGTFYFTQVFLQRR